MLFNTQISDAELLNMLNSSDNAAYTILYNRYWKPIRAFGLKMTRNDEVFIDDLVQETFISLYKIKIVPDASFSLEPYLLKIMKNKVIDHLRKGKRKNECFESLAAYANEASYPTDANLIMKDFQALVRKGVDQMPERMKQVMLMNEEQFLKREEIATALDISEETVKNQLYKGRKILRSMLKLILTYYFVLFLNKVINLFS